MNVPLVVYVPAVLAVGTVGFLAARDHERALREWYERASGLLWVARGLVLASWFLLLPAAGVAGLGVATVAAAALGALLYFEDPV